MLIVAAESIRTAVELALVQNQDRSPKPAQTRSVYMPAKSYRKRPRKSIDVEKELDQHIVSIYEAIVIMTEGEVNWLCVTSNISLNIED